MRITILSGLFAKGPAAVLVEAGGARLLFDLGRGPEPGAAVPLDGVGRVDALLLTHGHVYHAGALDRLTELGDPPVWATAELRALRDLPEGGTLPLSGSVEVAGLAVRTGRAGHAPGGVWLHLAAGEGLLYTGDVLDRSEVLAFDPPPAAGTLLVDASYGLDPTPLGERRAALGGTAGRADRAHGPRAQKLPGARAFGGREGDPEVLAGPSRSGDARGARGRGTAEAARSALRPCAGSSGVLGGLPGGRDPIRARARPRTRRQRRSRDRHAVAPGAGQTRRREDVVRAHRSGILVAPLAALRSGAASADKLVLYTSQPTDQMKAVLYLF